MFFSLDPILLLLFSVWAVTDTVVLLQVETIGSFPSSVRERIISSSSSRGHVILNLPSLVGLRVGQRKNTHIHWLFLGARNAVIIRSSMHTLTTTLIIYLQVLRLGQLLLLLILPSLLLPLVVTVVVTSFVMLLLLLLLMMIMPVLPRICLLLLLLLPPSRLYPHRNSIGGKLSSKFVPSIVKYQHSFC